MEKKLEELKQQLEKQCMINHELQRQNKDLGEYNSDYISSRVTKLDHTHPAVMLGVVQLGCDHVQL